MKTRTCFGAVLGTISVFLLLASPMAMADKAASAYKLDGAWVAKVQVPGSEGQWSYLLAPDASGRRAAGHGSVDVGFDPRLFGCEFGEMDRTDSPILINLEVTGPDTAVAYSVWYAINTLPSGDSEIGFIGEVRSDITFLAPGKSQSLHYFYFYSPDKDADPKDGFPDEGAEPDCSWEAYGIVIPTIETRVPAP